MYISKQKSPVKSKVSHYTKITLLGVIIIIIGVSGIILFIRTLELLQVSILALLAIAGVIISEYGWSKRNGDVSYRIMEITLKENRWRTHTPFSQFIPVHDHLLFHIYSKIFRKYKYSPYKKYYISMRGSDYL